METRTYKVEGLSCIDCAGRIQAAVGQLDDVANCAVDYSTGQLTVWLNTPDFEDAPIAAIVTDTGHALVSGKRHPQGPALQSFFRFLLAKRDTTLTTVAALLTVLGIGLSLFPATASWSIVPFAVAILVGGFPVARHARQEIFLVHNLGINALMVIAVIGAVVIGEWAEAAIVVVLFALGEALEGYAVERARNALESLLDLVPPTALRLLTDGSTEAVLVADLVIGDQVRVRPGDRVSVDGNIYAGQSAVDQAAITGESMPVDKGPGANVFAGTINTFGTLDVSVSRTAADNTLSRMITLVQEAQSRHAPQQRFIDRFARIYTPGVAVTALLIAIVPPLLFAQPFWGKHGGLMRALQMLVIACPCALVISTPVSVVSALTNAAGRGVLIKGGQTLAALGRVRVFAFDKTGTLTAGRPVTTDVVDICTEAGCQKGLQYAAAVEAQSSHPLAQAIVQAAQQQQLAGLAAEDVNILSGRAITGKVGDKHITVGSHTYFDTTISHTEAVCQAAEKLAAAGKTVMLVSHAEGADAPPQVCSIFAVADTLRAESREVVTTLRVHHKMHTVMLTGDSPTVAAAVGHSVGIDEVRAGLLPEDKVAFIQELQPTSPVAFVGDGVNDAPALAQANVGIALGGAGSHQAMETADVVLMGDDLRQLPFIVNLSWRTQRAITANIVFALAVKALVFALAAAGWATLWMAIVADVGASLIVILNGLRLRGGGGGWRKEYPGEKSTPDSGNTRW